MLVCQLVDRLAVDNFAAYRAATHLFAGRCDSRLGDGLPFARCMRVRRVPDGRLAEQERRAAGADPHAGRACCIRRVGRLRGIVAEDAFPVKQHLHTGGGYGQFDGEVLLQRIELTGFRGRCDSVGLAGGEQIAGIALQHQTVRLAVCVGAEHDLRTGPDVVCLRGDAQRKYEMIGVGAVDAGETGIVDIKISAAVGIHHDRILPDGKVVAAVIGADAGGEVRDPVGDRGHIAFLGRVVGGAVGDLHACLIAVDPESGRAALIGFVVCPGIGQDRVAVHEDIRALRRDDGSHGECFI